MRNLCGEQAARELHLVGSPHARSLDVTYMNAAACRSRALCKSVALNMKPTYKVACCEHLYECGCVQELCLMEFAHVLHLIGSPTTSFVDLSTQLKAAELS